MSPRAYDRTSTTFRLDSLYRKPCCQTLSSMLE